MHNSVFVWMSAASANVSQLSVADIRHESNSFCSNHVVLSGSVICGQGLTLTHNRVEIVTYILLSISAAEVALTRSADEECLQILHVQRMPTVLNEVQAEC